MKTEWKRPEIYRLVNQLFRFGIVGGLATLVHLTVAWWVLQVWSEGSPFLVNLVAFLVAFQVSFWGHSRYTFRQKGSPWRFLVVTVGGFVINNSLLWVFLAIGVRSAFAAICLSVLLVPLFVFMASRFWVFSSASK
ncbi:GtrA family protein [Halomonas sp. ISL-56]|uniref:GtrA family protein n=1 Tax=Halomonas sp. ISL-56 TaxID=2819149 RepID=UPI001BE9E79E|nr:GtrA family protein [Halomonas sp. ISL-56]MBT2801003.1 GtrA family protein [Halomonas sp. ISL-56]